MTGRDGYDVLAKWDGPSFNDVTRAVLGQRLRDVPKRLFFTEAEFALLESVCARLLPQDDRTDPIPIAPFIDADLADGKSEGFRQPGMLPPTEAWRQMLAGIDAEAWARHSAAFVDLAAVSQDAVLAAIQQGEVVSDSFGDLPVTHVFEQLLLKAAAGVYYSHPTAWNEIGFGGPASPRGYVRIGLDERDPWEAPFRAAEP